MRSKTIKGGSDGVCPYCGNDDWSNMDIGCIVEIDDVSLYRDNSCYVCDKEFRTYYSMTFDSHWEVD